MANQDAIDRLRAQMEDQFSFTEVSHPSARASSTSARPTPEVVVATSPEGGYNRPPSSRSGVINSRTPLTSTARRSSGGTRSGFRSGGLGGGSVASAAVSGISGIGSSSILSPTAVRPVESTPGAAGGGVRAGTTVSAYGKRPDYCTKLVAIREPMKKSDVGTKVCFAVVGKGGKVCMAQCRHKEKGCGTRGHDKRKYVPLYEDSIYVPCQPVGLLKSPTAYFEPSIGAGDLLPEYEVAFFGTNPRDPPKNTSYNWCALIEEAKRAKERANAELQDDYAGSEGEEDEEEDEGADYQVLQRAPDYTSAFNFSTLPKEIEFEEAVPEEGGYTDALQETRRMISKLVENLHRVALAIPLEGEEAAQHLASTVNNLVDTMNRVVRSLRDLSEALGDHDQITQEGYADMVDAILSKSSEGSFNPSQSLALKELGEKVDNMYTILNDLEVDIDALPTTDHVNVAVMTGIQPLGMQITAILQRLTQVENAGPTSGGGASIPPPVSGTSTASAPPSTIPLSCWLTDDSGSPVIELSTLLNDHRDLVAKVANLEASVSSQGGVVIGSQSFASERALRTFMLKHAPHLKLDDFAAFPDACSLFSFDKEADDSTTAHQMLQKMGVDNPVTRRFINSFKSRYPSPYTGGNVVSEIRSGEKISCLSSRGQWNGVDGNTGDRQKIKDSIRSAKTLGKQYCTDHLPSGPLRELAKEMVDASEDFHEKLHNHFEDQLSTLVDSGIPVDEVLTLLSDQFVLLFGRLYSARKLSLEYTRNVDVWDWGVRAVWVAMKALQIQDEATKAGLKQDSGMGISFVHFLTKQTGKKFNQMLGGGVEDVTKVAKAARDTANTAKAAAESAKTNAEAAHNKIDQVLELNSTLVKPKKETKKRK